MTSNIRRKIPQMICASCVIAGILGPAGASVAMAASPQSSAGVSSVAPLHESKRPGAKHESKRPGAKTEPCINVPPGPQTFFCAIGELFNTLKKWDEQAKATNG